MGKLTKKLTKKIALEILDDLFDEDNLWEDLMLDHDLYDEKTDEIPTWGDFLKALDLHEDWYKFFGKKDFEKLEFTKFSNYEKTKI